MRISSAVTMASLVVVFNNVAWSADESMRLEDVVDQLCTEVKLGLSRGETERILDRLPVGRGFRSGQSLAETGEGTFEGQVVSGAYVVETRPRFRLGNLFFKEQAFFTILFDERDQVLHVAVRTFGIPAPTCPERK